MCWFRLGACGLSIESVVAEDYQGKPLWGQIEGQCKKIESQFSRGAEAPADCIRTFAAYQ